MEFTEATKRISLNYFSWNQFQSSEEILSIYNELIIDINKLI
jgi:hypothetical protein